MNYSTTLGASASTGLIATTAATDPISSLFAALLVVTVGAMAVSFKDAFKRMFRTAPNQRP